MTKKEEQLPASVQYAHFLGSVWVQGDKTIIAGDIFRGRFVSNHVACFCALWSFLGLSVRNDEKNCRVIPSAVVSHTNMLVALRAVIASWGDGFGNTLNNSVCKILHMGSINVNGGTSGWTKGARAALGTKRDDDTLETHETDSLTRDSIPARGHSRGNERITKP